MVSSELPENNMFPSWLNSNEVTEYEWPYKLLITVPFAKFTILILVSVLPEANIFPLGLNAIAQTALLWEFNNLTYL